MQHATLPREADAYGRLADDFRTADEALAIRRPIPRTLRRHAGERELHRAPLVLGGLDPTAARLKAVVARARGRSAFHPLRRTAAPQSGAPRLAALCDAAEDRARGMLDRMIALTIGGLLLWVGVPVLLTTVAGRL